MFDYDSKETKMLLEVSGSILDLPKVSIVYSTDDLFTLCVYSLDKHELETIKHFFDVSQKYNLMSDEIKIKYDIFNAINEDLIKREKKSKMPFHSNRITALKKPSVLERYSKKELGTIFRRYSFRSYLDKRKQKLSENDIKYIVGELIKKYSGKYNSFLRVHLS